MGRNLPFKAPEPLGVSFLRLWARIHYIIVKEPGHVRPDFLAPLYPVQGTAAFFVLRDYPTGLYYKQWMEVVCWGHPVQVWGGTRRWPPR